MILKLRKRMKSEDGAAELISALFILPLVIMILFTVIDVALYFNNRSIVQAVARDGARSVAIMGGNGNATMGTPIEKTYGISRNSVCGGLSSNAMVKDAYSDSSTPIECNVMKTLSQSTGLVNVTIQSVKCNPEVTANISERTSCTIDWHYGSIPASGLVLLNLTKNGGMGSSNVSTGTAESEVSLDPNAPGSLVARE